MSGVPDKYHHASHSKYLLKVHLVFACKYRKKLFNNSELDASLKEIVADIAANSDFDLIVMETDKDHVHLMVDYPPTLSVFQIVRRLKSLTTRRLWERHEDILQWFFWKERTFWSDGYFACSTGDASAETIKKYIEEQG
jgi:putative transposase